jgi:hypothetical protein
MKDILDAFLAVDCSASVLMHAAGNSRQREQLRDALQELRAKILDVVANNVRGDGALDVETFRHIVRRGASLGLWPDMTQAFNDLRQEFPHGP